MVSKDVDTADLRPVSLVAAIPVREAVHRAWNRQHGCRCSVRCRLDPSGLYPNRCYHVQLHSQVSCGEVELGGLSVSVAIDSGSFHSAH